MSNDSLSEEELMNNRHNATFGLFPIYFVGTPSVDLRNYFVDLAWDGALRVVNRHNNGSFEAVVRFRDTVAHLKDLCAAYDVPIYEIDVEGKVLDHAK